PHPLGQLDETHFQKLRNGHFLEQFCEAHLCVVPFDRSRLMINQFLAEGPDEELEQLQSQRKIVAVQVLLQLTILFTDGVSLLKKAVGETVLSRGALHEMLVSQSDQSGQSVGFYEEKLKDGLS